MSTENDDSKKNAQKFCNDAAFIDMDDCPGSTVQGCTIYGSGTLLKATRSSDLNIIDNKRINIPNREISED